MDIKTMANVGKDIDAGIDRLTARNLEEILDLGINDIFHKLTADTNYSVVTLFEAKTILGMFAGQNLVKRLVAGEIAYYPLGEVKLDITVKCKNPICQNGYVGAGFVSTELPGAPKICSDCNACELYDEATTIIH
jgi:hypothetical protein